MTPGIKINLRSSHFRFIATLHIRTGMDKFRYLKSVLMNKHLPVLRVCVVSSMLSKDIMAFNVFENIDNDIPLHKLNLEQFIPNYYFLYNEPSSQKLKLE